MLSDILPTGFECGVLNGCVKPGDTVAIVGAGPIGLAALLTARFFSPAEILMVDTDDNRLEVAKTLGATQLVNNGSGDAVDKIMALTANRGVDVAIEAVGVPATFDVCQSIVTAGGHIANIGVHGKPVQLNLDQALVAQQHHADDPSRRYRDDSDDDEDGGRRQGSAETAHHPSIPAEGLVEGLRHLRPRHAGPGPQGDDPERLIEGGRHVRETTTSPVGLPGHDRSRRHRIIQQPAAMSA